MHSEKAMQTDFLIKTKATGHSLRCERQPVPYVKDKSMQQLVTPLYETPSSFLQITLRLVFKVQTLPLLKLVLIPSL